MIRRDNAGSVFAMPVLARRLGPGLFHDDAEDLATHLHDGERLERPRASVRDQRARFAFGSHADELVRFFRAAVARRGR